MTFRVAVVYYRCFLAIQLKVAHAPFSSSMAYFFGFWHGLCHQCDVGLTNFTFHAACTVAW